MSQVVDAAAPVGTNPKARKGSIDAAGRTAVAVLTGEEAAMESHLQQPVVDDQYRFTGESVRGLSIRAPVHPARASIRMTPSSGTPATRRITNEHGKVVFEQPQPGVPQGLVRPLATNVVASKYFRGQMGTPQGEHPSAR